MARTDVTVPPDEGSFARMGELADHEQVLVKASAIPFLLNEAFPHDHVR